MGKRRRVIKYCKNCGKVVSDSTGQSWILEMCSCRNDELMHLQEEIVARNIVSSDDYANRLDTIRALKLNELESFREKRALLHDCAIGDLYDAMVRERQENPNV
jgi:hypothetical protein